MVRHVDEMLDLYKELMARRVRAECPMSAMMSPVCTARNGATMADRDY
jgi:hypothetical protein